MSSVYKESYTRVDPKTGRAITRKYKRWTIKFKDSLGKWRRVSGYRDKEASLQKARQLEKRAERERAGIHDPFEDHQATELSKHLTDFRDFLAAKGDCDDHVRRTYKRCKAIVEACGFEKIIEIDAAAVVQWIADQRAADSFGKQTGNYYLTAIKGFTRWLVKNRRAPFDALVHLSKVDTEGYNSRPRRAASAEQFSAIIKAASGGTANKRLSGPDRAALYMVAAFTGFRANELASVTPESFDLNSSPATLTVSGGYSKRRRVDVQPLRHDLVEFLQKWLQGREAGQRIWPGKWYDRAAEMLRADLVAAGVPYADDAGNVLDFHALRHTYITSLHRGGTYGKVLQSLARHSTPALTARYTHIELNDVAAALGGLPSLPTSKAKRRKQA